MKKIRSLNVNKKLLSLSAVISVGILGINLLDSKIEDTYIKRKLEFEDKLGNIINKKVVLGNYQGLRFFGLGISNSKISEKENLNSKIEAENIYVGIMPIRSILNQRWIINIKPKKTNISINQNFFKREKLIKEKSKLSKDEFKYDLNFHLTRLTKFKVNDLNIETKLKGNFRYSSKPKKINGYINSRFGINENLTLRFDSKLEQEDLSLQILSRGINLKNLTINNFNNELAIEKGRLKSNFKYLRSSKDSYCEGSFSLNDIKLKAKNLEENITSDYVSFICENNDLKIETNKINYGALISEFNVNVPIKKGVNDISLNGNIRFSANPKSKITLKGKLPYSFNKKGLIFGEIDSIINLSRTELANLNIFRKNGIQGLITAKGHFKGSLANPDLKIKFDVDTPYYKGIRFRETWIGDISNENENFLVNIQSRSRIPSFLSLNFDSNIQLNNLVFTRKYDANNEGTLNIVRNSDNYSWEAKNLPLDELEFSPNNNKFDRISGTINGSGILSTNLSSCEGKIGWSFGKFRNLDLRNAYFNFNIKDNQYFGDSLVIPDDGGLIKILFDSNKNKILDINFDNVSTKWAILNVFNTFKIDDDYIVPKGEAKSLNVEGISNQSKTLIEQIKTINEYKKDKILLEKNLGLENYFSKFESRYSGNILISGDSISNYKINSEINGFIDLKTNDVLENKKESFSLKLNGGLFKGRGDLLLSQIPLKSVNIFLEEPKDIKGAIDLSLNYDLENKSFKTKVSAKNTFLKEYGLKLEEVSNEDEYNIGYNINGKNRFDLDFSLSLDETINPIKLNGYLPSNKNGILDLRLIGRSELLKLINVFYGENINFKKGEADIGMRIRGPISQPIFEADLKIRESEIDIFQNNLKDVNTFIEIIEGDQVKVNRFNARGEKQGSITIFGNLPIYEEKLSDKKNISFISNGFNLVSKNNDLLLDSVIKVGGSFQKPTLKGQIALSDGLVNIKNSKREKKKNEDKNKKYINKNNLGDLFWGQNKNVEVVSSEELKISKLITMNLNPEYLFNLSFDNFKLLLGPDFRLGYTNNINTINAYLETAVPLIVNGSLRDENKDNEVDLNIRGLVEIKKGNLRTALTPFKFEKNNNSILFARRLGINPLVNLNLTARVPEPIMPIRQNMRDGNIPKELDNDNSSDDFGTIGIGNSRTIKIDASYSGVVSKLSTNEEFENFWFNRLKFRSSPSRSRSEIISLIGGNSANLINRAFISQLDGENAFSERFQLSLYPAIIENNESINNVFSGENADSNNSEGSVTTASSSSQAWVAEIGLDITDAINFAVQATPDRDDLPPLGILTLQANEYLELLGSYDSDGDWKSQIQLFFRY